MPKAVRSVQITLRPGLVVEVDFEHVERQIGSLEQEPISAGRDYQAYTLIKGTVADLLDYLHCENKLIKALEEAARNPQNLK